MSADICSNRHRGAQTSVEAFRRTHDTLPEKRAAVLALFWAYPTGLTSKAVARMLDAPLNEVSGRISELKKSGHIAPNGDRRDGCAVLVITRKGGGK